MAVVPILRTRLTMLYERARRTPIAKLLIRASEISQKNNSKDIAAGIAYYTFLSLFPLILGLISLGGFFLRSEELQLHVNILIVELLPVSADFITRNIESLVHTRGAAGIASAIALLWSARMMVGAISRSINRALGMKRGHTVLLSPLRYFVLTVIIATLVIITIALAPIAEVLAEMQLEFIGPRWNAVIRVITSNSVGVVLTVLLLTIVYTLIPYQRLRLLEVLPGLFVATLALETGKWLFSWYVEQAVGFNMVYGSVSSIIVMLIWLYFVARILLYGAEIINVTRN